jgi:sortase A
MPMSEATRLLNPLHQLVVDRSRRAWQSLRNISRQNLSARLCAQGWKQHLPTALMLIGLSLLLYVGVQYGTMLATQRRLAQQWEQQEQAARAAGLAANDELVRLSIPKIELNAVIVEGTSHKELLIGPGHLQETPEPGMPGNSVISGHRDTFFRRIHELSNGDIILVQHNGKTFSYEVTGKKIVSPYDISVIQPSDGTHLTLITCYPTFYVGPAPERLVVLTRLLDSRSPATETATGPGVRRTPLTGASVAAAAGTAAR